VNTSTPRGPRDAVSWIVVGLIGAALAASSPVLADPTTAVLMRAQPLSHPSPMLLGDVQHTGISRHPGPRRGEVVWRANVPGGLLAPPSVDAQGQTWWVTQAGALVVLDADGGVLRRMAIGSGSHSVPALGRAGDVYTTDRDGRFMRLSPEGEVRWVTELEGETVSSPLLDEDGHRVIVSVEDRTIALDLDTGQPLFEFSFGNARYNSSPALGPDGLVRITNWDGWIAAIEPNGAARWKRRLARPGKIATPTLDAFGGLYTALENGEVMGLTSKGRPLWIARAPGPVLSFLAMLPDGRLIVPVATPGIQIVEPSGALGWYRPLDAGRLGFTVAVDRVGTIYYATAQGTIGALDRDGEPVFAFETGAEFGAGPVIVPPRRGNPRAVIGALGGEIFCIE